MRTDTGTAGIGIGAFETGYGEDNKVSVLFILSYPLLTLMSATPHLDHRLTVTSSKEVGTASAAINVLRTAPYLDWAAAAVTLLFM